MRILALIALFLCLCSSVLAFNVTDVSLIPSPFFINDTLLYCNYTWNPDSFDNATDCSYYRWFIDGVLNATGRITDSYDVINEGWINGSYDMASIDYTAETYAESSASYDGTLTNPTYGYDELSSSTYANQNSNGNIYENISYDSRWMRVDTLNWTPSYYFDPSGSKPSAGTLNVSVWNYTSGGWSQIFAARAGWSGCGSGVGYYCGYYPNGTYNAQSICLPATFNRNDTVRFGEPMQFRTYLGSTSVGCPYTYQGHAYYYDGVLTWLNYTEPYLNASASDFNVGDNITCEVIPNPCNASNGTSVNSTEVGTFPVIPELTQDGSTEFNQTVSQNTSDSFDLDVEHDYNQTINYTFSHDLNASCFNITFDPPDLQFTSANATNSTNITIEVNGTCSGMNSGHIILTDSYYGNSTYFDININVTITSPIISISPLSWSASGLTTDTFSTTFNVSNTGTANATSCSVSSSGSLVPSVTSFNVSVGGSENITVTISGVATGNYNEFLDVSCGGVHTSSDVNLVFAVSAPSTTTTTTAGGGTTIVLADSNISIKTEYGGDSYALIGLRGSSKTFEVFVYNNGDVVKTLSLACVDLGKNVCDRVSLSAESFQVLPSQDPVIRNVTWTPLNSSSTGDKDTFVISVVEGESTYDTLKVSITMYPPVLEWLKRFFGADYRLDMSGFKEDARSMPLPMFIPFFIIIAIVFNSISKTKASKGKKAFYGFATLTLLAILFFAFMNVSCGWSSIVCGNT
jgi:hypothetical protein